MTNKYDNMPLDAILDHITDKDILRILLRLFVVCARL